MAAVSEHSIISDVTDDRYRASVGVQTNCRELVARCNRDKQTDCEARPSVSKSQYGAAGFGPLRLIGCLAPPTDYVTLKATAVIAAQLHTTLEGANDVHAQLLRLIDGVFLDSALHRWLVTDGKQGPGTLPDSVLTQHGPALTDLLSRMTKVHSEQHLLPKDQRMLSYNVHARKALYLVSGSWKSKSGLSRDQLSQVLFGLGGTLRLHKDDLSPLLSALVRVDLISEDKVIEEMIKTLTRTQPINDKGQLCLLNTCMIVARTLIADSGSAGRVISRMKRQGARRLVLKEKHVLVDLLCDYTKFLFADSGDPNEMPTALEPAVTLRLRRGLYEYERQPRRPTEATTDQELLNQVKEMLDDEARLTQEQFKATLLSLAKGWAVSKRQLAEGLQPMVDDEVIDRAEFKKLVTMIRQLAPGRTTVPMEHAINTVKRFVDTLAEAEQQQMQ